VPGVEWGLLGSEKLESQRRRRTLGLAGVVSEINELAVPGLGGVWFGKQLLLAALGIAVSTQPKNNIRTSNAIEAIACWSGYKFNDWTADSRLRGRTKLPRANDADVIVADFSRVSRNGFYVTQPLRMATVQALPALGLVEPGSERFNSYALSEAGKSFISLASDGFRPGNTSVEGYLQRWAGGQVRDRLSHQLRRFLSPRSPMNADGRNFLLGQLNKGAEAERRRGLLTWVEALRSQPKPVVTWNRPDAISQAHWRDIETGADFFATRTAAIQLLEAIEARLGQRTDGTMDLSSFNNDAGLRRLADTLRQRARDFLARDYDPTHGKAAQAFCRECIQEGMGQIRPLIGRDDQALRMKGDLIARGPLFKITRPSEQDASSEAAPIEPIRWPAGISRRVRNIFYLNADLKGDLDRWIADADETEGDLDA
jgi:hypothetical protein